jgi:hypothetical protein
MLKQNANLKLVPSYNSFESEGDTKLVDASEVYFEYSKGNYFSANYKGYELARTSTFYPAQNSKGDLGKNARLTFRYGGKDPKYYTADFFEYVGSDTLGEQRLWFNVYFVEIDAAAKAAAEAAKPAENTTPGNTTPGNTTPVNTTPSTSLIDSACESISNGNSAINGDMKGCLYKSKTTSACRLSFVSIVKNCDAKLRDSVSIGMTSVPFEGDLVGSLAFSGTKFNKVGSKFMIKLGDGSESVFTSDGTNFFDSDKKTALLIPSNYLGSKDYAVMYPSTANPAYYVFLTLDLDSFGSDQIYLTQVKVISK